MAMTPIRPELGLQDWSPIARGGEAYGRGIGQGLAALGQGIGKGLEQKKQYKQAIASAKPWLDSLETVGDQLPPGLAGNLQSMKDRLSDEEVPLSQRAAIAGQISNIASSVFGIGLQSAMQRMQPQGPQPKYVPEGDVLAYMGEMRSRGMDYEVIGYDQSGGMFVGKESPFGAAPSTVVNLPGAPTAEDQILGEELKGYSKDRVERQNAMILAGESAEGLHADASRGISLIEQGARTGLFQDQEIMAKKVLELFGAETDVEGQEELNKLLGDQVMSRIQQTKGSVSDPEMKLFQDYSAAPNKSPEGNLAILRAVQRKAKRDLEVSRIIKEARRSGKSSADIGREVDAFIDKNPLFDKAVLNSDNPYQTLAGGDPNKVADTSLSIQVDPEIEALYNSLAQ